MLKIICFLLFIIYSYVVFLYSSKMFLNGVKNYKYAYYIIIFNCILLGIFLIFNIIIYEWLLMIIYFVLMYLQFKLVYNDETIRNIFGVLCFAVNFFGIRLIFIGLYSIIMDVPIYLIMNNLEIITIITIITFIITIIYITSIIIFIPVKHMHMMVTDKGNLIFSLSILGVIYAFLLINSNLLYVKEQNIVMNAVYVKIGICTIIGFLASLSYCYLFSRLQLYVVKAENIEKEIQEEEIMLKQLENEANYDYFTSCLKRDVIYKKIDDILEGIPFFCIAFIDIDGLKITNDQYGHDEGDFYIKAVAEILNSEFIGKAIGRIVGDEFLVVLEHTDIYAAMKCVIRCFERVENISKMFNKPYSTSISYGVIEVTPDNKLSRDEIIKQADIQMYNFKKSRKKNRK